LSSSSEGDGAFLHGRLVSPRLIRRRKRVFDDYFKNRDVVEQAVSAGRGRRIRLTIL
jgi:hypothetical protein